MSVFSYRNRRAAKKALLTVLIVAAVLALLILGRAIYVQRFIKYTPDGARLDYEQAVEYTGAQEPTRDPADYPFETVIESDEEFNADAAEPEQPKPLRGYYISTSMLVKDPDGAEQTLSQLEDCSAVMLDVKSIYGNFYYSTNITGAVRTDAIDTKKVDAMIKKLAGRRDLTLIARVPAFSDRNFALAHQSEGLPLASGALWEGDDLCYWLDPTSEQVQGYLVSIAIELSQLGFDEVLFDGYFFPASENIVWNGEVSREEAAAQSAAAVKDSLYGYGIRVDFGTEDIGVAASADRIFITSEEPESAGEYASAFKEVFADPASQIVFLTESRDTRFEVCGVMRPLLEDAETE